MRPKRCAAIPRGPVASIFYQGLDRAHEGVEMAEKSVAAYGGVTGRTP
ncbi:MAG: hypothetical protein MZV63_39935 [Marinilabiliales bacterium]|nr:hypothetical protein [Marinilabiliales bacterium]